MMVPGNWQFSVEVLKDESEEKILIVGEGQIRNVFQVTAEVVDKEYCQARKPENRFKVTLAAECLLLFKCF